jgi:MFS family permease
VLQKTLRVPPRRPGKVRIDYLGTSLIAGGVSLLLIWVSLAGNNFAWISVTSGVMLGASILLLVALVFVELRVAEPIIPMTLFASRTFTLSVIASIAVGVGMFGTTVYLTEYMQLSRGATPTGSGLMTFPLIAGLMVASTVAGALISKRGYWKSYMVTGAILMTVGMGLMATMQWDTNFWLLSAYMVVLGSGVGMVMQNLVLIVQNDVDPRQIGVASSGVAFFRTLGGTIGVSALGGLLTSGLTDRFAARQADLVAGARADREPGKAALAALQNGETRNVHGLIEGGAKHTAAVIQSVFGSAIGELFLVAAPLAVITILALVFLPNKPLGQKTTGQRIAGGEGAAAGPHRDFDAEESSGAKASGEGGVIPGGVAVGATHTPSPIVMDTIAQPGEPAGETGSARR